MKQAFLCECLFNACTCSVSGVWIVTPGPQTLSSHRWGTGWDKSPRGVTAEEGVRKLPGRLSGQRKVGHKKSMAGRGPSQTQH